MAGKACVRRFEEGKEIGPEAVDRTVREAIDQGRVADAGSKQDELRCEPRCCVAAGQTQRGLEVKTTNQGNIICGRLRHNR